MATHFICQSTEPLPHNYPSRPGRSHGAVSQYEVYNNSNKPHTRFPPPGWDFSQSSEDDSLPLLYSVPQPELKNSSFLYDPDLCITPQKVKSSSSNALNSFEADIFKKPEVDPDPDLTLTPMKALEERDKGTVRSENLNDKGRKQKVRFDLDETITDENLNENLPPKMSPEKQYRPELYNNEEDEVEFDIIPDGNKVSSEKADNARTVRYKVNNIKGKSVYVPLSGDKKSQFQNEDKASEAGKYTAPQCDEVDEYSKNSSQCISKTKSTGQTVVKVVREKSDSRRQPSIKQGLISDSTDPVAACKVPEDSGPKRKVKVLRENQYTPKQTEYTYPFQQVGYLQKRYFHSVLYYKKFEI